MQANRLIEKASQKWSKWSKYLPFACTREVSTQEAWYLQGFTTYSTYSTFENGSQLAAGAADA